MGGSKSFGTLVTETYLDSLFALFFGQAWDQVDQKGQYLAKNAKFGRFGAKNPNFSGTSKSFGTHITEHHLGTLIALFFDGHGTKWTKNANIWPKMSILGQIWLLLAKYPFFWGEGVKLWYPHIREPVRHLFRVDYIDL